MTSHSHDLLPLLYLHHPLPNNWVATTVCSCFCKSKDLILPLPHPLLTPTLAPPDFPPTPPSW